MRRLLTIISVTAALGFAACGDEEEPAAGGGGANQEAAPTATEEASPEETQTPTPESGGTTAGADGKQLFTATCGGCHTLADAGTRGPIGPNLDEAKPDKQGVLGAIENGPGAMPANLLEGANREAVAEYVSSVAGG